MKNHLIGKAFLFAACLALILSVDAFGAGGKEAAGKKTKLVYWTQAQPAHKPMVAAFTAKYPNIEVEQVDMPADEQRQVIMTALSSGTGPDVFYFELGSSHVDPLIKANMVVNLEKPADRFGWKKKMTEFARAEATHYGTLWGIPNESEFIAMFYNKNIFKQLGVEVPKTWNELVAVCEKARGAGFEPISFGVGDKWAALHRISLAYQWGDGGTEAVRKALFENGSFDTPEFVKGLDRLLMVDKTYMPNSLQRTMNEALAVFWGGKAAMLYTGTWVIGDVLAKDAAANVFDFFIPPKPGTSDPDTVAGCGGGWYASAKSAAPEECLTFLDFALSDANSKIWFEMGYIPAAPMDLAAAKPVSPLQKKVMESIPKFKMGYFIHHFISAEMTKWLQDGYQGLVGGSVSPAQYAKRWQEIAAKSRAEGFKP